MGKARIAVISDEPKEVPPPYNAEVIQVTTPVGQPRQTEGPDHAGSIIWYVISILSTFCCFFPCNIIGLVHAMISKHEAERGNMAAHKRRLRQAKCWTGWSIGLGLATLITLCILFSVCGSGYHMTKRLRKWQIDDVVDDDHKNPVPMAQEQKSGAKYSSIYYSTTAGTIDQSPETGQPSSSPYPSDEWRDSSEEGRPGGYDGDRHGSGHGNLGGRGNWGGRRNWGGYRSGGRGQRGRYS